MNKNIIIAIIIVVIIAVVGVFVFSQPQAQTTDGKINTQLNFLSGTTLKNGDQVQFELKDTQGAAIAGQTVVISYDDGSGNIQKYTINTDQNGKGYLTISGEDAGSYTVTLDFAGNDKYNGCNAKQTITIEEGTSDAQETVEENSTANTVMYNNNTSSSSSDSSSSSSSSSSSDSSSSSSSSSSDDSAATSSSSQSYYDADLNVYYNSEGVVIGGQSAGSSIWDLRQSYNNPDMVSEDGSLQ